MKLSSRRRRARDYGALAAAAKSQSAVRAAASLGTSSLPRFFNSATLKASAVCKVKNGFAFVEATKNAEKRKTSRRSVDDIGLEPMTSSLSS